VADRPDIEDGQRASAGRAVGRAVLVTAIVVIVAIVAVTFVIFHPAGAALKVLAGGCLAGALTTLLIYLLRKTVLKPIDDFESNAVAQKVSDAIIAKVATALRESQTITYPRWNRVDWSTLLGTAQSLEFAVSYMDTWVANNHELLLGILERGGSITAYLPTPTDAGAERVRERFPEYDSTLIKSKISGTGRKLHGLLTQAANASARVEVCYTDVFIMHCLMMIDKKLVVLSPFDHFRRLHIEGPAWVMEIESYPEIGKWAEKEFAGFKSQSQSTSPR
jgi:hypothetical protein